MCARAYVSNIDADATTAIEIFVCIDNELKQKKGREKRKKKPKKKLETTN